MNDRVRQLGDGGPGGADRARQASTGEPAPEGPSLLASVRRRLRLPARARVRGLMSGEHRSVHAGRSPELEDLRDYRPGDDARDVDWKASARSGSLLLRRYVAERKQHLLLAVDTGASMRALAAGGAPKRELAVLVAGALGEVAMQGGDLVGMVAGDAAGLERAPMRQLRAHLERLLRQLDRRLEESGAPADVVGILDEARRLATRRSLVAVVTDDGPFTDAHLEALRRLRLRHEVLWITIRDTDLADPDLAARELVDVVSGTRLPAVVRADRELQRAYADAALAAAERRRSHLRRLGVAVAEVAGEADVVPALVGLLERARRA